MKNAKEQWELSYSRNPFCLWIIMHPTAWPLLLRRAMFVTLPISGPLWLASCVAAPLLFWIGVLLIGLFNDTKAALWDSN